MLGVLGLWCFKMYEDILVHNRLVDLQVFKKRTVLLTYSTMLCLYIVFCGQLISNTMTSSMAHTDCNSTIFHSGSKLLTLILH